ncbi:MAG TPA: flagellar protein FlgN [Steroidobacteraceae bacterium]|nr:flagellar protein FlgN [Steroidobacteraceae bacterium]
MHAQDLQPELRAHLDAEIAVAESLLTTLEEERTALKGTDASALDRAGAAKLAALKRFEQVEQERRLMCQGYESRASFEQLIDALDRQASISALRTTWQRLLEITSRCRDANQANGLIVGVRQKQIRQLLGVLRGTGGAETYGPNGARSSTAGGARAIARA